MTSHLFAYDADTRTLRGILLPFGELSSPSVSGADPVMFGPGTVGLPRDPSVVTLNRRHNRFDPVGRATVLAERPEGIYAEFAVAATDEGDAYLAEELPTLRALSAELAGIVRDTADAARAVFARLTGAALVPAGAFAGAGLFAAMPDAEARPDDDDDDDDATDPAEDDADATDPPTTDPDPDAADPDDADPIDPEEEETATMSQSIVPGHVAERPRPTLDGMFSAIARNDPAALDPYRGAGDLFALKTLGHSGTGVTVGTDTARPDYLGELWSRAPYARRIVPLLGQAVLTSWQMIGWQWAEGKSPTMEDYAGNAAEVPTGDLDTVPVTVSASRLAGGHRLDRRYTDFNDSGVVGSYVIHQVEDYKRKTDAKALAAVVAAATPTTLGTVPAGIAKGLAAVVDGALDVITSENTPAYALVSPELWRDILLTPKDDILAYLESGFGLDEGGLSGFKLRPAAVGTGQVVVGAREALTFYELGETPIRVEGVVPGNGATEVAAFGYWATLTNNAQAIRKVSTLAAG